MEPMRLKPAGKDYLWGGTRLKKEYGKEIDLFPLAETWECSVHPDGLSMVAEGKWEGRSLRAVLQAHPEYMGSKVPAGAELPILVKFIDAREDLSVQVHPDDAYARQYEGQNGKTEMWYVLDAEPGAEIVYGFEHPVTEEQLKQSLEDGSLSKHLHKVRVRKGDVYYIPPGLVHAIGRGILLAEIQESSNVTYRVYDYERLDKNGKKRPLHFEKAMQVLDRAACGTVRQKQKIFHYTPGCAREMLCRCEYFETERIQIKTAFSFAVSESSFCVLLCVEGSGTLETAGSQKALRLQKGDCIFIPAGTGACRLSGEAVLLKIRC